MRPPPPAFLRAQDDRAQGALLTAGQSRADAQAAEHTLNTLRYSDRVKELKGGGSKAPAGGNIPYDEPVQVWAFAR